MPVATEPSFLIRTKLKRPLVPGDLLPRPRLCARLDDDLDRPLTFVSAPAGFGKTTLLVEWLKGVPRPSAWLSLDERDSDLAGFLNYFVAAIRTIFPHAGANTLALIQAPQLPSVQDIIACLLSDFDDLNEHPDLPPGQRFILILDDLHLVREPTVYELLDGLLTNAPDSLHLVLSTRPESAMLITLEASGENGRVPAEALRFTSQEMATFMRQAVTIPLDRETLDGIERRTEGWAAGLRLTAVSINATGSVAPRASELPLADQFAIDFLMHEVLDHIPPPTVEFLVRTSILDRLTGGLCAAVIGDGAATADAGETLQWLAATNLFTESLDSDAHWFRYHHLFQQLLRQQLNRQYSTQEITQFHARASRWFTRHGFADEAVAHAIESGDHDLAAQTIEAFRHSAMNQERWAQLEAWLRHLPREIVAQRPGLMTLHCWLLHLRFQLSELSQSLDALQAMIDQTPLPQPTGQHLQSEIDTLRSRVCFWQADAQSTLTFAQRGLATAPLTYAFVRANAWSQYAAALYMQGHSDGADQAVQQGLQEAKRFSNSFKTLLLLTLCYIHWCNADLEKLVLTSQRAIELGGEERLTGTLARAHHYLGCAYYQRNQLQDAAGEFGHVLKHPHGVHALVIAQSGFGLVATHQAAGADVRAGALVMLGKAHALRLNNPVMLALDDAFNAQLALRQGRRAEATLWAASADRSGRQTSMPTFFVPDLALAEVLLNEATPASLAEASELLARLHTSVTTTHNRRFLIDVLALQALVCDTRGDQEAALATLERAVSLAQPGGVLRVFTDLGPAMGNLLARLSRQTANPGFIARILQTFPSQPADLVAVAKPPGAARLTSNDLLTKREMEVLELLAEWLRSKEIGELLGISDRTVKRHIANIYHKLDVNNGRQAVATAIDLGLLPSETA
ncbi:MAG: LuxR C-terminal-related transcriptional regulator [Anaerolineae bacterium]|nr:LuxR C-terminal-related transcriptional regulator [Anaerolineae bacterium]